MPHVQLSPIRLAKKICLNKTPATKEINGYIKDVDRFLGRVKAYITRYNMAGSTRSRIASDISYSLGDITYNIDNARNAAKQLDVEPKTVDMREVIRDLEKLAIDGTISFDHAKKEMIFTSDDITLVDVEFGRFEIRVPMNLEIRLLRVVAITPNICPSNTNITHPHVLGDNLCLGEVKEATKLAFREGRILDIVEMVNSTLTCYNSSDAHQMIQVWKGTVLCGDCGEHTLEDEIIGCDSCQNVFCNNCVSGCGNCGKTYCASCMPITCKRCKKSICISCTNKCRLCYKYYCSECMSDNQRNRYCDSCQKSIAGREADTQIHADCVGQTAFFER